MAADEGRQYELRASIRRQALKDDGIAAGVLGLGAFIALIVALGFHLWWLLLVAAVAAVGCIAMIRVLLVKRRLT